MFCLNNILVKHGNGLYHQKEGKITGDNNSVSIANIALHYRFLPIAIVLNLADSNGTLMTLCLWQSVRTSPTKLPIPY